MAYLIYKGQQDVKKLDIPVYFRRKRDMAYPFRIQFGKFLKSKIFGSTSSMTVWEALWACFPLKMVEIIKTQFKVSGNVPKDI